MEATRQLGFLNKPSSKLGCVPISHPTLELGVPRATKGMHGH